MKRTVSRLVLVLALCAGGLLHAPRPVGAANTYNVTTTNKAADGQCALVEAVENILGFAAHSDCPGKPADGVATINLRTGTYTFTGAYPPNDGNVAATALPILGTQVQGVPVNITINGNNSTITRGANSGDYRYFYLDKATLTMNDVTITGARLPFQGSGANLIAADGALYNDGGAMTLNGVTMFDNAGPSAGGGAGGGAVTSIARTGVATLAINNSVIRNNSSLSTTDAYGAGAGVNNIAVDTGTARATITNTRIADNIATNQGAGVSTGAYFSGGARSELTIDRSSITGNRATGIPGAPIVGFGGGVANFNNITGAVSDITITNTTISGNRAENNGYGGGFFHETGCVSTATCGTANATLNGVTISDNVAGREPDQFQLSRGGGIWTNNQANPNAPPGSPGGTMTTTIRNTIVAGNNFLDCRDAANSFVRQGYNIATDTSCGFNVVTTQQLNLGALAQGANGTLFRPLQAGSAAIDRVPAGQCTLAVDQVGNARPRGVLCDVGAFEAPPVDPVVCSPRPRVNVTVERVSPGVLRATIASTTNERGTPNSLVELRFSKLTNASIDDGSGTPQTQPYVLSAPGQRARSFLVSRVSGSGSATAELTVADACDTWQTFVGGGPAAFQ